MTCLSGTHGPKGEKRPEDSQSLHTTALLFYSTNQEYINLADQLVRGLGMSDSMKDITNDTNRDKKNAPEFQEPR